MWDWQNDDDLEGIEHDFNGTSDDVSFDYTYDRAARLVSETVSNATYRWQGERQAARSDERPASERRTPPRPTPPMT